MDRIMTVTAALMAIFLKTRCSARGPRVARVPVGRVTIIIRGPLYKAWLAGSFEISFEHPSRTLAGTYTTEELETTGREWMWTLLDSVVIKISKQGLSSTVRFEMNLNKMNNRITRFSLEFNNLQHHQPHSPTTNFVRSRRRNLSSYVRR